MTKTFSTKLDVKILRALENFCQEHHLKKSHFLEEIIKEGIEHRQETFDLALSIQKGLDQESKGELYTAGEVEKEIFKKA